MTMTEHRDLAFSARTALDRFFRRVEVTEGCWLWRGDLTSNGYGRFYQDELSSGVAHRWLYKRIVGAVPDELHLDHLCRVRNCVNVDHLEPVTTQENTRRSESGRNMREKTHCPFGHPYDAENTRHYTQRNGAAHRSCRTCERSRATEYRNRKKALA